MPRYRPVMIACPQYQVFVRGQYECDAAGKYHLASDGRFLLTRTRCDHYGGRCAQTLCVLHRFNKGGAGSWYPEKLVPAARTAGPRRRTNSTSSRNRRNHSGQLDIEV